MQFLAGSKVCSMKYSIENGPAQILYFDHTHCFPLPDFSLRYTSFLEKGSSHGWCEVAGGGGMVGGNGPRATPAYGIVGKRGRQHCMPAIRKAFRRGGGVFASRSALPAFSLRTSRIPPPSVGSAPDP
mmetsp:Transcript_11098/g.34273  ORF Transcript_11098/g.34273 Transcript_11098/m.34273 type:complete len:128 (+) Transcript_11098:736-1119(+)